MTLVLSWFPAPRQVGAKKGKTGCEDRSKGVVVVAYSIFYFIPLLPFVAAPRCFQLRPMSQTHRFSFYIRPILLGMTKPQCSAHVVP
jgi:hypothetical protein